MTNCCVRCYTSVGCAACYVVISVWGIVMLGIMAILFGIDKAGNIGDLNRNHTRKDNTKTLWINVIIYFIVCILSSISLCYRLKHPFEDDKANEEVDEIEEMLKNAPEEEQKKSENAKSVEQPLNSK